MYLKTKLKGSSKYKNKNPDVALLWLTVKESSQCWIHDDFKKKSLEIQKNQGLKIAEWFIEWIIA